jgi:hypothetical protein
MQIRGGCPFIAGIELQFFTCEVLFEDCSKEHTAYM